MRYQQQDAHRKNDRLPSCSLFSLSHVLAHDGSVFLISGVLTDFFMADDRVHVEQSVATLMSAFVIFTHLLLHAFGPLMLSRWV